MTLFYLGVNNCFAVKRWPMPKDWAEICSEELDVNLIQFSFDLLDPRTIKPALSEIISEIRDAVSEKGLIIHSTFTGLAAYSFNLLTHPSLGMRLDALDWYSRAIKVTGRLNVKCTGGHVASLSYPDYQNEGRRKYLENFLLESLHFLSHLAYFEGLSMLLWEPMPLFREPPCTIADSRRLLNKINEVSRIPIKLTIDVGHQCTMGIKEPDNDVYSWLMELSPESPVIHLQQTDGKADRHWPFTEKYNEVGIIKPEKIINAIEKSGAKEVYLMLEIIHPFEAEEKTVLEDLKVSVNYWRNYI